MPVLAIAVGMHELNVLCGGSLFMHLPEDLPKALPHKDLSGGPHRHIVLLEPGTRMDAIYGGGEIRVNSYHHQAVQNLATGFRVGAKSPDGMTGSPSACSGIPTRRPRRPSTCNSSRRS
jgi:putative glutamine amidotransferase